MGESNPVIAGEHTYATVMTDEFDETTEEQLQEMVNHEAFGQRIAVMPDCHAGAGAVIGFTMPFGDKIVPNTVGVDIGCGMTAINIGIPFSEGYPFPEWDFEHVDDRIREAIPMGKNVHDEPDYHIVNDFPWSECDSKWISFASQFDHPDFELEMDPGYGEEYFKDLCDRVNYDINRAIVSMGTLGGGNHFIEISRDQSIGDYWVVVHSGSRGIGYAIANYWQDLATSYTTYRATTDDVPEEVQDYLDDDWKPKANQIREDFEGEDIQLMFDRVSQAIQEHGPSASNRNTDLDWLEGGEIVGYVKDMIFAQTYAAENRLEICRIIAEQLEADIHEVIESTHNYIDFDDMIIRKGATRAHEDERLVIPFNMAEGSIICRGKSNDVWNYSAPHGAGRRMSRTQAFNELDIEEFEETMQDVFSTSVTEQTLDEAPQAYKDTAVIESVINETAEIIDRLEPVINLKAEG